MSDPAIFHIDDWPEWWCSTANLSMETVCSCRIMIEEPFSALPVDKIAHHLKTDVEEMMEQSHGRLLLPLPLDACLLLSCPNSNINYQPYD